VVHVIWNTAAQNITDAQINSQIAILNADFRRTNGDSGSVPMPFSSVAADARIEFALAVRDPNCGSTTGITRTNTSITGFTGISAADERMKSTAQGGHDPWNIEKYMNVWVVNYTDGTLGYGTFPAMPANIQGLVCDFRAFGNTGTAAAPYNLGRTATHEIGHYFNLLHIWGDDQNLADQCSGSDECGDTPNQAIMNFGKPAFPHVSCSNGPNGDMFMDYMDYTDDDSMFTFTEDQATRMNAALSIARASLLSSDGLVPVGGGAPTPDLWMQDNADDTGVEPDPSTNPMWISDDIWVRNAPDGLSNQDHQNPLGEQTNYAYVRVRNRGCTGAAAQSGTLKLYWAKASSSLSWPSPWDGSVTSPALMGALIGSQSVNVNGGDTQIVQFSWTPPDPSDYASFGADQSHFCLLARIETSTTAPFGMTSPETGDLYGNVQNNNNIVWKNVAIVDTDGAGMRSADVVIGGFDERRKELHLRFDSPGKRRGYSLFDWGFVIAEFKGTALSKWAKGELKGDGFERLDDGRIIITKAEAELVGPAIKYHTFGTLHVQFVPDGRNATGAQVFELDVTELDAKGKRLGGQRFLLKTPVRCRTKVVDTQLGTFDGVTWMPKGDCCC
jgi:Pregnancy-associated plasma protein-A